MLSSRIIRSVCCECITDVNNEICERIFNEAEDVVWFKQPSKAGEDIKLYDCVQVERYNLIKELSKKIPNKVCSHLILCVYLLSVEFTRRSVKFLHCGRDENILNLLKENFLFSTRGTSNLIIELRTRMPWILIQPQVQPLGLLNFFLLLFNFHFTEISSSLQSNIELILNPFVVTKAFLFVFNSSL